MTRDDLRLEEAVAVLERTPATVGALLDGAPETFVRATEGERTWSPYDVVGHLVHGERADWLGRAGHILAGDQSPFTPFDRGAQFRETEGKSLRDLLTDFDELRRRNVAVRGLLRAVPHDEAPDRNPFK